MRDEGRAHAYSALACLRLTKCAAWRQGEAVNPKNMSLWERLMGCAKHYDPEADRRARKDEGIRSAGHIEAAKAGNERVI